MTYAPVSRIWSTRRGSRERAMRSSSIWNGRHRPSQAAYLHRGPTVRGRSARSDRDSRLSSLWRATFPDNIERDSRLSGRCYLALHLVGFAWPLPSPGTPVRSYRTLSPLTSSTGADGRDCSLLHVPAARGQTFSTNAVFLLGSTVPCGVRTFLTAERASSLAERHRRSDDPARTSSLGKRRVCARSSGRTLKARLPFS